MKVTIIDLDLSRYNAIASRFAEERQQTLDFLKSGIATRNPHFNRMIEQIEKVAIKSRAPILLNGPTGAGKSFLARRIFELKQARHQFSGAFVEVNCATLRGDTAMSTLFGHVKARLPGRGNLVKVYYAAPTAECCFLMRLANWAQTNKQCC